MFQNYLEYIQKQEKKRTKKRHSDDQTKYSCSVTLLSVLIIERHAFSFMLSKEIHLALDVKA